MNRKSIEKRARLLATLVEGNGVRSTARLCNCSTNTVIKFVRDMGNAAQSFMHSAIQNLSLKTVQVDEIWSYIGNRRNKGSGYGDCYTWVAIDPDSKLAISFHCGKRTSLHAKLFLDDLSGRVGTEIKLNSDGYSAYPRQVTEAFGCSAIHQVLPTKWAHKHNGDIVSTNSVERFNKTIRSMNGRFVRRSDKFSKSLEMHTYSLAIMFFWYNFGRIHKSLRVTPAMELGLCDFVWTLEQAIKMIDLLPEVPKRRSAQIIKLPKLRIAA